MSDALQLGQVDIRKFRRLSQQHLFEFAAGPGITILVGPNGSGKSTVLDAIEWALTRSASRLPHVPVAPASRTPSVFRTLGSDEDPEVVLTFTNGSGDPHRLSSADGEERVAQLLRRDEAPWSDIKSVAAALRWTHFSSQRSTARLGYEHGDAILKAFAAPAGLERLKGLDRRLWGRETQSAVKELEREVRAKERQHSTALDRLDQLRLPLATNGDLATRQRLNDLREALAKEPGLPPAPDGIDLERLDNHLATFRSGLEARLGEVRSLRALLRDANPRVRRLTIEEDEARQSLRTAEQMAERRVEARGLAASERDARQAELDRMNATRASLAGALGARAELLELQLERGELRRRAADTKAQGEAVAEKIARLDELEAATTKLRAGTALQEIDRSLAELAELGDPEEAQASAARQVAELSARRDELAGIREQLQGALSDETDRLKSLAALAAAVAAHLHAEDTRCPVCAAAYELGELATRARAAAFTPGPAAQQITKSLNETTHELGRVSGQMRIAVARAEEARAVAAAIARHQADRARQLEAYGDGQPTAEALEEVQSRIEDLREELEAGGEVEARFMRVELQELQRRLAPLLADLEARLLENERVLETLAVQPYGERPETDLRAQIRAVDAQIDQVAVQLTAATTEYGFAVQLAEGVEDNLRRLRELHGNAEASLFEESRRVVNWTRTLAEILDGAPEDEFAERTQEQSVRIGILLERLASIRDEVARARQSPDRDDELTLLRATYLPSADRASPAELREAIDRELRRARADLVSLQTLRKRLSQRARVRRDIDKRLQGTALRPWNGLFRAVYASLAGSLGETLEWTADRVDMRFREIESSVRPNVAGEPISGWLAGHYFSEGQLAALQISAMITASVLLPWSRWNALLLDDPLQHADVIKVGAFADLIRSLCLDKRHQIVMTTHDRVQAEFIAAKFAAGGLGAKIIAFERPLPVQGQ